jgi:hypothetical protein
MRVNAIAGPDLTERLSLAHDTAYCPSVGKVLTQILRVLVCGGEALLVAETSTWSSLVMAPKS